MTPAHIEELLILHVNHDLYGVWTMSDMVARHLIVQDKKVREIELKNYQEVSSSK